MKTDYQFQEKEVENFYYQIATRKPHEVHRGGGRRNVFSAIDCADYTSLQRKADILAYFSFKVEDFELKKCLKNAALKIYYTARWKSPERAKYPNYISGQDVINGKCSKEERTIIQCLQSLLKGEPNEAARAIFAGLGI